MSLPGSRSRLPPGPGTPRFWQTYRFIATPEPYAKGLQAKYGDAISFHSYAGRGIAIYDPVLAKEVLTAQADYAVPTIVPAVFGPQAVIATSGTTHKKQRKLLNPHFHGARIKAMLGTMAKVVRAQLEALPKGEVVRLIDVTQSIALDIILEAIFGDASEAERARGRVVLRDLVHAAVPSILVPALHVSFFPPWRRYLAARATFDLWVDDIMAKRRKENALGDDLLGLFLVTKYDDGAPMADGEIRDQLVTLLLAGHETSATAAAWAIYWLERSPTVLAKLRDEVTDPSPEALVKNAYLGAVCSEALRIEPIVTDVIRVCTDTFKLREWTLEKRELLAIMITAILKDERIYPEPHRFRPERFLEKQFTPTEFLPFGGGSRRCLGAAFAEAEMAIAVGILATEWNVELADKEPEVAVRQNITMGPKRGVRVRITGSRAKQRSRAA